MRRWVWTIAFLAGSWRAEPAERSPLELVELESPAVGRRLKVQIALPVSYEKDETRRYPTLYLLHGYGGNYTDWVRAVGVPSYAAELDLIVVMPDAGNSRYVNWAESAEGEKNDWEDYIVEDVVGYVDAHFRTIARREGRAINGLSMGGYGAITIGLRHPGLFVSIASSSGALLSAQRAGERLRANEPPVVTLRGAEEKRLREIPDPVIGLETFDSQVERTPNGRFFSSAQEATAHDPFRLVTRVRREELPHIFLDCGLDDELLDDTQAFAQVLLRNGIPFGYLQLPGGHDPAYWIRAIGHSMASQYEIMMRELSQRPDVRRRVGVPENGS